MADTEEPRSVEEQQQQSLSMETGEGTAEGRPSVAEERPSETVSAAAAEGSSSLEKSSSVVPPMHLLPEVSTEETSKSVHQDGGGDFSPAISSVLSVGHQTMCDKHVCVVNALVNIVTLIFAIISLPYVVMLSLQRFMMKDCNWRLALKKSDDSYFANKIAWVTGASSGIGRAMAIQLIQKGARVVISGRRLEALNDTKKEMSTHLAEGANVDDYIKIVAFGFEGKDSNALIAEAEKAWGWKNNIDLFFNNAGCGAKGNFTEVKIDYEVLHADLMVACCLTRWFVNKKCEISDGESKISRVEDRENVHGAVITTCSVVSRLYGGAAYAGSKAGVMHYQDCVRLQLLGAGFKNLRVVNILPGPVDTEFGEKMLLADGKQSGEKSAYLAMGMRSERCAELALKAVSVNEREAWITVQPQLTWMYLAYYMPIFFRDLPNITCLSPTITATLFKMFAIAMPMQLRNILPTPPPQISESKKTQ